MNKFTIRLMALTIAGQCAVAGAAEQTQGLPDHLQNLQVLTKQVTDEGTQLLQQQQALQDQIANLAKQRRVIEEREKELSRTMLEHTKRLEMQKRALETIEQQLSDEKRAYADQVKRFDDLRAQLDTGAPK